MAAKKRSTKPDVPASDDIDFAEALEENEAATQPKTEFLYWLELDLHVAPQQAESPDCAARRGSVTLRLHGENRIAATRKLEIALQRLVDSPIASVGAPVVSEPQQSRPSVNSLLVQCPVCNATENNPCIYDINNLSKDGDVHSARYLAAAILEKERANGLAF
jgi:hypothetical protein